MQIVHYRESTWKAKSLWAGKGWLGCPIAASPSPVILRSQLRVAALAFTRFSNHRTGLQGTFNNVSPDDIHQEMKQATDWLVKKRRWHMTEVVWSIHHSHKNLDRAGKASVQGFRYMLQDSLNTLVWHDLKQNNACWCAGSIWTHTNCIPMGGPFSAQGADLHSVWQAYMHRGLFRQLGPLTMSEGFPLLKGPHGKVALCQFEDNILVATDCPPEACVNLINLIRKILRGCWGLQVDCDCIAPMQTQCTGGGAAQASRKLWEW